jgi:hypothetical protein
MGSIETARSLNTSFEEVDGDFWGIGGKLEVRKIILKLWFK